MKEIKKSVKAKSTVEYSIQAANVDTATQKRCIEYIRSGIVAFNHSLYAMEKMIKSAKRKKRIVENDVKEMNRCIDHMKEAAGNLKIFSAIAGIDIPSDKLEDPVDFFKIASREFVSFGDTVERLNKRAEENNISWMFARNEEDNLTIIEAAREAFSKASAMMKEGCLPSNYFDGAVLTNQLTKEDVVYVRKNFGAIKRDEEKESFVAMFDVCTGNGAFVTVKAPMTYVSKSNKYFIYEDDYREVEKTGTPVMKIRFSKCAKSEKFGTIKNTDSPLKETYGYSVSEENAATRRNALLSAKKAGWKYADFLQYFNLQFLNRSKNPVMKDEEKLARLHSDFDFIRRITFGGAEKAIDGVDFVDRALLKSKKIAA